MTDKAAKVLGWLAPLVAGGLITLSFAPFFWWPLGILGALLMAWTWRQQTPRQAFLSGWLLGVGLFGSGASWIYVSIHVHGYAPVPLALFLTLLFVMGLALFPALQGWLLARFLRRDGVWYLLSFPSLWMLAEWFRGWFLTGFPWLYLGTAHVETPLAGWAPVAGVFGVSFVVAFSAVALLAAFQNRNRPAYAGLLIAVLLWGAGAGLRTYSWSTPLNAPLRVALVQGNIAQELKWREDEQLNTIRTYRRLSQPYWDHDLVLWPETAIPLFMHQAQPLLDVLSREARTQGATLISGIPTAYPRQEVPGYRIHNSILALGNGSGIYHKQKLVPFGEYVPLESVLRGLIQFFDLPMSSFTPGARHQAPLMLGQTTTSPFICYEVVYPDFVAAMGSNSDLLLTISNDSWFGASIGPHQHLQIAQMRALENARYMVRATNNGISAIIDEKGRILDRSQQFVAEVLTGTAQPMQGRTPFSQTGSMPTLVLAIALALLARRPRQAQPSST